jgi:hypothetical protein
LTRVDAAAAPDGDPGTAELAGEVANVVTWDVGEFTGLV